MLLTCDLPIANVWRPQAEEACQDNKLNKTCVRSIQFRQRIILIIYFLI